jgi:hypothetical protein
VLLICAAICVVHAPLQASNIATTVRTIIVGLVYLATFIFSANALGLTGADANSSSGTFVILVAACVLHAAMSDEEPVCSMHSSI